MAKYVAAFVLLLSSLYSYAEDWYTGSVVLSDNSVVVGQIARISQETILVRTNNGLMVYPAHKVRSFLYFDEEENINRRFVSGSARSRGLPMFQFYESVVSGRMNVWRRQISFQGRVSETDEFQYYVYFEGSVSPLADFRKKMIDSKIFGDCAQAISPSLNPAHADDVIRIILQFNQNCPVGPIAAR